MVSPSTSATERPVVAPSFSKARRLAAQLIHGRSDDVSFTVQNVLASHPDLEHFSSIVLDLAHEEYRRRTARGEEINPVEFATQFPRVQESLRILLSVEDYFDSHSFLLTHFQEPEWPVVGETFLGCQLRESLGRGAFSRVFLATESAIGERVVVVKICWRGASEAHALGKLSHPNIGSILSAKTDRQTGLTAIVMPFVSRATLLDVLKVSRSQSTLPKQRSEILDAIHRVNRTTETIQAKRDKYFAGRESYATTIVRFGYQLADALAAAHRCKVCHCDIKPSNVLVTDTGQALLVDFNLSQKSGDGADRIGGTLPYMAPEQLRGIIQGGDRSATFRGESADVFSLGVTLYELLCGKLPWGDLPKGLRGEELARHLWERQKSGARPIRKVNDRVEPIVARVLNDCLRFDPDDRMPSAEALAAAFRSLLSPWGRIRRFGRSRRLRAGMLGLITIVTIAAASILTMPKKPHLSAEQSRQLAEEAVKNNDETTAVAYFSKAFKYDPKVIDGETRAYVAYLLCKKESYEDAIRMGLAAWDAGYKTAIAANNLAYCYRMMGELNLALDWSKTAVAIDKTLPAANHNGMRIALTESVVNGKPLDGQFRSGCTGYGGDTAERHFDLARFMAIDDGTHSRNRSHRPMPRLGLVSHFCELSLSRGLKREKLNEIVVLMPELMADEHFQRLLFEPVSSRGVAHSQFFLAPDRRQ